VLNDGAQVSSRSDGANPPAVLHLLTGKFRGGIEEHSLSILARIGEFGFAPCIAAPPAILNSMGSEFEAAGVERFPLEFSSAFDLAAGARLARFVHRRRVAILHTHSFVASMLGAGWARMAGAGAVLETCHGPEVWRMGKRIRGSFWIDRQVARLVDLFIAVSNAGARHLAERKGIPRQRIRVIHNGRDLNRYRPLGADSRERVRAALGIGAEPAILVIGRLDAQKGHRHLLEAAARLRATWPELAVLLAGEGPLAGSLREDSMRLGLGAQVRFLGHRPDVPELLQAADVVVLPSLYEGLPLVAVEVLAAGRPLVATRVDGTPEVVTDGETGLLVAPADASALAGAIGRMLAAPALGARLGAAGRKFVAEHFTLERQIADTVGVYRELAGSAREQTGGREAERAAV
jgi:glycosyltransferase involved in cell wall biosynthesis